MLTYEQAVATSWLNALKHLSEGQSWFNPCHVDRMIRVYAIRRLRVRAGLTP